MTALTGSNLTLVGAGEGVVVEGVDFGALDDDDDATEGDDNEEGLEHVFEGADA